MGDVLTAVAVEDSATNRLGFYSVKVTNQGGTVVADVSRHRVPHADRAPDDYPAGGARGTVTDAFIIDGIRTPVGNLGGALSDVRADDLAAHVHPCARRPQCRRGGRMRSPT